MEIDERILVERACGGDEDAFRQLVIRYAGEIRRICFRIMKDAGEAEELAQDTFLRAWKSLRQLEDHSGFRAWLKRIAQRLCLNRMRKLRLERALVIKTGELPWDATDSQRTVVDGMVSEERVKRLLDRLKPEQRTALSLYLDCYTFKEISDLMQIPVGAVRSHIQNAIRNLRKLILEE